MNDFLTLDEIATTVRSCQRCALWTTRTNAVPGQGDSHAVVMFVGEGPGRDEDKQGLPFVGRSGQYLTSVMNSVGIRREDVYITNVVKCRPPENRDPLPQELQACSGYLEAQIALINPRIIVTLGRFSMRRWFPNGAITRIHGQVRNIGHGRVALAMFHPAAALRNPNWQEAFVEDMAKLPGLIERAKHANERAVRGEGLYAGEPHPGDADYVASHDKNPKNRLSSEEESAQSGTANSISGADTQQQYPSDAADKKKLDLDDAQQLSLL